MQSCNLCYSVTAAERVLLDYFSCLSFLPHSACWKASLLSPAPTTTEIYLWPTQSDQTHSTRRLKSQLPGAPSSAHTEKLQGKGAVFHRSRIFSNISFLSQWDLEPKPALVLHADLVLKDIYVTLKHTSEFWRSLLRVPFFKTQKR